MRSPWYGPVSATVLALAILLSGCVAVGNLVGEDLGSPGTGDVSRTHNLTVSALHREVTNKIVTFRATQDTTVNVTFANGGPDGWRERTWSGCGSLEAGVIGDDGTRFERTHRWVFSNGHAFTWATSEDADSLEHPAAQENMFLAHDFQETVESVPVEAGDDFKLSLAARQGPDSMFDPFLNVTADRASLELVDVASHPFRCGANLEDFSGTFADVGLSPVAPTVVEDASLTYEAGGRTEAVIGSVLDPRFSGTCTTRIVVDGEDVDTSGPRNDACLATFEGPAKHLNLKIDQLVGNGPQVAYFILDRPALLPGADAPG